MFYALPLLLALPVAASASTAVNIPVHYIAGRIIAQPRTTDGHTLNLWVDTGGGGGSGMYLLTDDTVQRLHLHTSQIKLDGQVITVTELPGFAPDAGLPAPAGGYAKALVLPAGGLDGPGDAMHYDGMLGAGYLPGNFTTHTRIWTFDYPGQRLIMQSADWRSSASAHVTPLHFPTNAQGQLASGFARIIVKIGGQPFSMLLDTGATGFPTPSAIAVQGGKATVRATSFITTSQFERWHKAHPDWRIVERADRLPIKDQSMRAIEVPAVVIGGWSTGPVWFTERPDANFHKFMSSMMDAQVEGAIGGNVFEHFVMTVDYGHAKAWFRCVQGCKSITDH